MTIEPTSEPEGSIQLLPGWDARLIAAETARINRDETAIHPILPKSSAYYTDKTLSITTVEQAWAFIEFAMSRPLSHIGIDSEYRFSREPWYDRKERQVHDVRSVQPLLLSIALVEASAGSVGHSHQTGADTSASSGTIFTAVFDVRNLEVAAALAELFTLSVPFVGHFLKAEFMVLKQLGLPIPRVIWDTWVCEKAACLGRFNPAYEITGITAEDEADEAQASEYAESHQVNFMSLLATCQRHGVPHRFAAAKERLQQSFLVHGDNATFSEEQIAYAAEDAIAAAQLYSPQIQFATIRGILHHLTTVEMPWVVVNTALEWVGIRIDRDKATKISDACARHLPGIDDHIRTLLKAAGVAVNDPINRHGERTYAFRQRAVLLDYARKMGLIEKFQSGEKYELTKNRLKEIIGTDEVFDLVYVAKRIDALQKDCILNSELVGADGRVHPVQQQLGADTGRQTTRNPNILGLPSVMRPLIIGDNGNGIGEVDLTQIEVGVAAAVYRDQRLIDLFNAGDVYIGMVKLYYGGDLTPTEHALPDSSFKKVPRLKALRNKVKTLTLGIIYGVTAHGIGRSLSISTSQAKPMLDSFLALFPDLRRAQDRHAQFSGLRGYAATATGLRRYRGQSGAPTRWERNWMINMPVQAGAAVAFKLAGIRLLRLYPAYGAMLIAAVHDAYVFEAPVAQLTAVAALTSRVLCDAVQECYPVLLPRADVNIDHPECWNKDGNVAGWSQWLDDPMVMIAGKGSKGYLPTTTSLLPLLPCLTDQSYGLLTFSPRPI